MKLADLIGISENYDQVQTHVIFVHGLSQNSRKTWTTRRTKPPILWPKWLADDISGVGLWLIEYAAAKTNWTGYGMPLTDRADNILARLLAEKRLEGGELVFVAHSLGGLIVEQLLRSAQRDANRNPRAESLLWRTRGVAFLGTPHRGALLADVAKTLHVLIRPSAATRDLVLGSPQLRDLNHWYRTFSHDHGIENLSICEGRPERILGFTLPEVAGKIVYPMSSDGGFGELPIQVDQNHSEISRPASREAEVYIYVKDFISSPFNASSRIPHAVEAIEKNTSALGELADVARGQTEAIERLTRDAMQQLPDVAPFVSEVEPQKKLSQIELVAAGVRDVRAASTLMRGFQGFLLDEYLPYFSRDEFARKFKDAKLTVSEEAVLAEIAKARSSMAILFTGSGGAGKTRLARQICKFSSSDRAFQITTEIDYISLGNALRGLSSVKQVTFFLDYAELFSAPQLLVNFVETIEIELGIISTVILCARTSGARHVLHAFGDLEPLHFDLDTELDGGHLKYRSWLVERILGHFDLGDNRELLGICKGVPFLAAFAGYLRSRYPEKFTQQFAIQVDEPSFENWARRRIEALASAPLNAKQRLAEIALALPFPRTMQDKIIGDPDGVGGGLLEALVDDQWVWENEGMVEAVHDALTDAIVSEYVFGSNPSKRLKTLLTSAADGEYFTGALQAVFRISSHRRFEDIDGIALIEGLVSANAVVVSQFAVDLIQSPLLQDEQIPDAIQNIDCLFEGLKGDLDAHRYLARVAFNLAQSHSEAEQEYTAPRKFELLLEEASRTAPPRVVADLLSYRPFYYERAALRCMNRNIRDKDNSFVITRYLYEIGNPFPIENLVLRWTKRFWRMSRAAFVLVAWVAATQASLEKEAIIDSRRASIQFKLAKLLQRWCEKYADCEFAWRALQAFFEISPSNSSAWLFAKRWLRSYATLPSATFILQKACRLDHYSIEEIAKYALEFLSVEQNLQDATKTSYLFHDLRMAGATFEPFREILLDQIKGEDETKARRDMTAQWLQWGGPPNTIKNELKRIIAADPKDEHVRFVIESWLKATSLNDLSFKNEMKDWILENATHPEAYRLYAMWLDQELELQPIAFALSSWLDENRYHPAYQLIYKRIVARGSEEIRMLMPSELNIRDWLRMIDTSFDSGARLLLERVLDFASELGADLLLEITHRCETYVRKFSDGDEELVFLLSKLVLAIGLVDWVVEASKRWLLEYPTRKRTGLILQSLLNAGYDGNLLLPEIQRWLDANPKYELAAGLFLAWSDSGSDRWLLWKQAEVWLVEAEKRKFSGVEDVAEKYAIGRAKHVYAR